MVSPKLLEDRSDEMSLVFPWLLEAWGDVAVDAYGPELEDDSAGEGLTRVVGTAESVCVLVKWTAKWKSQF